MTLRPTITALHKELGYLERCAEVAPVNMYNRARDAVEAVGEAAEGIIEALRNRGFNAPGDDRLRNLEAAIYAYLRDANPEEYELITAEGFGEHVDGPAGKRVLDQAFRDRDTFLRRMWSSAP